MNYSKKTLKIRKIQKLIKGLYLNGKGEPFEATYSQAKIFLKIIDPKIKWLFISATTRYGKSEILAMALIYLASVKHLKIPIVGGSKEKANKIMEYVLQHLSDNKIFYEGLINLELTDVEKLKVKATKEVMRWHTGGWIFITSVESGNTIKEGEGVIGEGGDVVVLEEAGLIKSKEQFSKIVRMSEENKGWGKLIMSGNMIEGSVFEDAYNNELYDKIVVDLETCISEGRFSRGFIEEKKKQTTSKDWKRYYIPEFPEKGEFAYFKPSRYEILPRELVYYGALDPSLGETAKSSKSGIIILGVDTNGQIYEVDSIVEHLSPDEAIRRIFNLPYTFKRFYFESIQFQKYFLSLTKAESQRLGLNIPFEGIKQSKNKLERIESLEPLINTKQILFKGDNQLWVDMQDYPKTEFLDGLDALEMAFRATVKAPVRIAIGDDMY